MLPDRDYDLVVSRERPTLRVCIDCIMVSFCLVSSRSTHLAPDCGVIVLNLDSSTRVNSPRKKFENNVIRGKGPMSTEYTDEG